MRTIDLSGPIEIPPQDPGRGEIQIAIDCHGRPFLWSAERQDYRSRPWDEPSYRFLLYQGRHIERWPIDPVRQAFPRIYPMADERIMLIQRKARNGQHNAWLYSQDGRALDGFHIGDAVADVQISQDNEIWVGYTDEASAILRSLDTRGKLRFRLSKVLRQRQIAYSPLHCYALNVFGPDVWAYHYGDPLFSLVRIAGHDVVEYWNLEKILGAHAFAIHDRTALFAGTYDKPHSLFLFGLDDGSIEEVQPMLYDEPLVQRRGDWLGRGSRLYTQTYPGELRYLDLREMATW